MYLTHRVRDRLGRPLRLVELALELNAAMPEQVARRVQDLLNDDATALRGASVLLLGVTYKPDVPDLRETPARPLAARLLELGATVRFHDPYVTKFPVGPRVLRRETDLDTAARDADVVVLL